MLFSPHTKKKRNIFLTIWTLRRPAAHHHSNAQEIKISEWSINEEITPNDIKEIREMIMIC